MNRLREVTAGGYAMFRPDIIIDKPVILVLYDMIDGGKRRPHLAGY